MQPDAAPAWFETRLHDDVDIGHPLRPRHHPRRDHHLKPDDDWDNLLAVHPHDGLEHRLNAPGKFLISTPEHTTPRRARAYRVDDCDVTALVARHTADRPQLDALSRDAVARLRTTRTSRLR